MSLQSVAGIIFSKNKDKVLLIKRRDIPVWVLPGGGLEPYESLEQGALREAEEETNLKLKLLRKVGTFYPKNKLTQTTHLFEFYPVGGQLATGPETADFKYFKTKNLPRLMPPPYQEWIQDALLNLSAPFEKTTESVTYLTLIQKLIAHPLLVSRYFIKKII